MKCSLVVNEKTDPLRPFQVMIMPLSEKIGWLAASTSSRFRSDQPYAQTDTYQQGQQPDGKVPV